MHNLNKCENRSFFEDIFLQILALTFFGLPLAELLLPLEGVRLDEEARGIVVMRGKRST